MFVTKSKYETLEFHASAIHSMYRSLLKQHNALITRVNQKGGEEFLTKATIKPAPPPQFTSDEIAVLIRLCHPDRHDSKESAKTMTQKLLKMRG